MFSQIYDFLSVTIGSVEQNHLNNQLAKYLKVAHILDEKRTGQKQPKRDQDFADQLKLNGGMCSGWTALYLYACWLQDQPQRLDTQGKPIERDDLVWLQATLKRLAKWKGNVSKLTTKDAENIDRVLNHVEFFQNIDSYLNFAPEGELATSLEDTNARPIKKEFALGGCFTIEDLIFILPQIIKENRMLLIGSHNHATGIYVRIVKKGNEVWFYNSNRMSGGKKFSTDDIKGIAQQIFLANFSVNNIPCPLRFRSFALGDNVVPVEYPDPVELQKKTECMRNPKHGVNYVAKHADLFTPLIMAVSAGDAASTEFLLQQGADAKIAMNNGWSALDLAAEEVFSVKIMELLLKAEQEKNLFYLEQPEIFKAVNRILGGPRKVSDKIVEVICLAVLHEQNIHDIENFSDILSAACTLALQHKKEDLFFDLAKKKLSLNLIFNDSLDDLILSAMKHLTKKSFYEFLTMLVKSEKIDKEEENKLIFLSLRASIINNDKAMFDELSDFFQIGKTEIITILKRKSEDDTRNLFQLALAIRNTQEIVDSIIKKLDIDEVKPFLLLKDQVGNNVFHLAASVNDGEEKIKLFVNYFKPKELAMLLTATNQNDSTVLHAALSGGAREVNYVLSLARELDQHFRDTNVNSNIFNTLILTPGSFKQNALHLAVNKEEIDIIGELIKQAQADSVVYQKLIMAQNNFSNNILHMALRKRVLNLELLQTLLKLIDDQSLNVLFHVPNNEKLTPFMMLKDAVSKHHENKFVVDCITEILEKRGIIFSQGHAKQFNIPKT